jgi:uncharacterized protein (TIGR02271 family)
MLNDNEARQTIGTTAYSADGDKIGKVGQLFLDDQTGRPEFITVNTGLFGTKETYIPIADATFSGDRLTVPFDKEKVKNAPNVDAEGGHLEPAEERRLYEYYGLSYGSGDDSGLQTRTSGHDTTTTGTTTGTGDATLSGTGTADRSLSDTDTDRLAGRGRTDGDRDADADFHAKGHDTSGPTTDDAMTRSEEHLQVGTTSQEAGRARLRKYVTTEEQTVTVPVQKEKAVLEREPITDANVGDAVSGAPLSDEEHEVVLSEERVVVDKEATPVERVRLGTETVTDQETVTEEVRKEHIETDGDVAGDRDRDRR